MEVGTDNDLLQKAYSEGKMNELPWIKQLSIFLQNNGIGTMEAQMGNLKENYSKSKVKQRLQDQYIQKYDSYIIANSDTGKTSLVYFPLEKHLFISYFFKFTKLQTLFLFLMFMMVK